MVGGWIMGGWVYEIYCCLYGNILQRQSNIFYLDTLLSLSSSRVPCCVEIAVS